MPCLTVLGTHLGMVQVRLREMMAGGSLFGRSVLVETCSCVTEDSPPCVVVPLLQRIPSYPVRIARTKL